MDERDGTATLHGSREVVQAATSRRAELEAALSKLAQRPVRVEFSIAQAPAPQTTIDPSLPARRPMQDHPLVRTAIEELGAVFVREAPRGRPPPQ